MAAKKKSEPKSAGRVGSWSDIPDKTFEKFYAAAYKLRDKMVPSDCDGDAAVQLIFVDRRKDESMHFFPVPHGHKDWPRHKEMVVTNLKMAVEKMGQMFRMEQFHTVESQPSSKGATEEEKRLRGIIEATPCTCLAEHGKKTIDGKLIHATHCLRPRMLAALEKK